MWLSRDTYEGNGSDAPSLHRYMYAHSNPVRYTDPTGHCIYQSCKELWDDVTGSETTGAPQPGMPVVVPPPAKPKEYSVVESDGTQEKISAAEKKAKGIGPTPRTFKHYWDLVREEEERKAQTQVRGTILVAGMAVMTVAPMAAPLLVETAGISAGAATLGVGVAGTAGGAGQEYGLTGRVTPGGVAMSAAFSALVAAKSYQGLVELQAAADARAAFNMVDAPRLARANAFSAVPSQTGTGTLIDSADEAYEAIRASTTDVAEIAASTGFKEANISKIKQHLFEKEHLLDRYVDYGEPARIGRFDSDRGVADAWERLRSGNQTAVDVQLLKHETAEAWYMRQHGEGYNAAHSAASRRYPSPTTQELLEAGSQ